MIDIGLCGFIDIGTSFRTVNKGHWMVCDLLIPVNQLASKVPVDKHVDKSISARFYLFGIYCSLRKLNNGHEVDFLFHYSKERKKT